MLGTVNLKNGVTLRFNNWALFAMLEDMNLDPSEAATKIEQIQKEQGIMGVIKVVVKYGDIGYTQEKEIARQLSDKDIHAYVSSGDLKEMMFVVNEFAKWTLGMIELGAEAEPQKKKAVKK